MVIMLRVKIRGIYSTALTKFLQSKGYKVANLSEEMQERIQEDEKEADVVISDKDDKNGVIIVGADAKEIAELIRDSFDAVMNVYSVGDIYCGVIENFDQRTGIIEVNIGEKIGILNISDYYGFTRKGERVLVQIKHNSAKPLLTTKLRLFGNDLILIKGGFNNVSKYIRDEEERRRLISLANVEGWGILWKATAENKPAEVLLEEVKKLQKIESKIKIKFDECKEPQKIFEGMKYYIIDFGANSKLKLDKIREKVLKTIEGHHILKSGGYSLLVDFAEMVNGNVIDALNKTLKKAGPRVGWVYEIIHKKMDGKDIFIKGIVKEITEKEIVIERKVKRNGTYDGLEIPKEVGDKIITRIYPMEWKIVHEYYSKDGKLKGKYININTPVEVYPRFARYIDLEVDVIEKEGNRSLIDVELLEKAKNEGKISQQFHDYIMERANKILIGGDEVV